MAKERFDDLVQQGKIDLDGKFILVETKHDGYTSTYLGNYVFGIVKDSDGDESEAGEYKVFPLYLTSGDEYVNEKYPVLFTDEDKVIFSARTLVDPYDFAYPVEVNKKQNQTKEHLVLEAFRAFAHDRFRLSVYNILMVDEHSLADGNVAFSRINDYERDVVDPLAGI